MYALKATQFSFSCTRSLKIQIEKSNRRGRSAIRFSNSEGQVSGSSIPEGDKRKQDLLAQIALLQAQKVRLVDFIDDQSTYLSQFAEDANSEFDAIGENAFKELDIAGSRIMEKLESQMQALQEPPDISRQEIASNDKVLGEFEEKIMRDRNEGLFFKNLPEETRQKKAEDKEAQKLRLEGHESAASRVRRNIYLAPMALMVLGYLALMALMVLALRNAFVASSDVDWRKFGALSFILVGLLPHFM